MGRHRKPSPIRRPNAVPAAAATTLASVVAAVFMSQQALAATPDAQAASHLFPVQAPVSASTVLTGTFPGGIPGGAFGQCVVQRESGGNPQIMNGSGHYGLYQFSASTWAEYGGNPADFGHASVAEQNQVFANALAQGGEFNWAPYDGC